MNNNRASNNSANVLNRLLQNETIRYILAGGLTTFVNFASFALLMLIGAHYAAANTIAFIASVIFAYYANERFVFRVAAPAAWQARVKRWTQFVVLRTASYAADMGLMVLLVSLLSFNALLSKIAVNVVIIVINYAASKFHIFRKEH